MKKMLLLLFSVVMMQSCTKDKAPTIPPYGRVIEGRITFLVSDAQGHDLLNPTSASPKAVNLDKVKVIYIEDGKEKVFLNSFSDAPRAFSLVKPEAELNQTHYRLFVYTDCGETEEETSTATTILEWDDGHRDVVEMEFFRPGNGSIFQRKAWVNGKLIWDSVHKIGVTGTIAGPVYEITR